MSTNLLTKYNNNFLEKFSKQSFKYNLRNKLSNIKNVDHCIEILKLFETTDEIFENIVNAFHNFHPNDNELQTYSLIFQKYQDYIDNKGFAASTLWYCVIQWIIECDKNTNKNKLNITQNENNDLREKLSNIKSIDDCVQLLEMFETRSELSEKIINILHESNPTEHELQKFSLIFQKYHNFFDNKGYAADTLWFCIIQWIHESEKLKKNNNL